MKKSINIEKLAHDCTLKARKIIARRLAVSTAKKPEKFVPPALCQLARAALSDPTVPFTSNYMEYPHLYLLRKFSNEAFLLSKLIEQHSKAAAAEVFHYAVEMGRVAPLLERLAKAYLKSNPAKRSARRKKK